VAGEFEKAADRYRVILGYNNRDVLALNNLAYHLATRAGKPGDALPLAEQAYYLSRGEPNVTDTLAWVHHLMGRQDQALRFIAEALRRSPNHGELHFHAAAILDSVGRRDDARAELKRALELNPSLAGRDEVKTLQAKLAQP
jgi:Flp pilus assembly protein TadD